MNREPANGSVHVVPPSVPDRSTSVALEKVPIADVHYFTGAADWRTLATAERTPADASVAVPQMSAAGVPQPAAQPPAYAASGT